MAASKLEDRDALALLKGAKKQVGKVTTMVEIAMGKPEELRLKELRETAQAVHALGVYLTTAVEEFRNGMNGGEHPAS